MGTKRQKAIIIILATIIIIYGCGIKPESYVATEKMRGVSVARELISSCGLPTADSLNTLSVSWLYDWSSNPSILTGFESVPMIFNDKFDKCPVLGGNSEYVLGFNEPDVDGQAQMTALEGAMAWHVVESCYPDKLLVSPATVIDTEWLSRMSSWYRILYLRSPRIDAVAIHCYPVGGSDVVDYCRAIIESAVSYIKSHNVAGGIWVTEFGSMDENAESDLARMLSLLQGHDYVSRYAFFAYTSLYPYSSLYDCGGVITEVGSVYDIEYNFHYIPFVIRGDY